MKENVIDVLMFLFDNYFIYEEGIPEDEMTLACELEEAGFDVKEITQAFDWLGELADLQHTTADSLSHMQAMRVFTAAESQKLEVGCLSYLLQLEDMGLIDARAREVIIDRAMAIQASQITLPAFKRIVGLVMMNNPHYQDNLEFFEELVCETDTEGVIH